MPTATVGICLDVIDMQGILKAVLGINGDLERDTPWGLSRWLF